ncbi:hypothetical protein GDO78_003941, partial [Eleutherodactylus coqui]
NVENLVKVSVGDLDFATKEISEQSYSLKYAIKHPNFNPSKPFNYDIAILELAQDITFDKNIQPACLPNPDDAFASGSLCITLGWGRLNENGKLPTNLQQVALPLIDKERCLRILNTVDSQLGFDTVVCAGFPEGGKDACQGDSGGPLLCQRGNGRWTLVGITSWGSGCARKWNDNFMYPLSKRGSPGVFTDIQRLLSWLSPNLNEEKSDSPTFEAQCSTDDGFLRGVSGEIVLPKGKRKYSNNEKCIWTILVPKDKHILLRFNHFDVEWDYFCDLDYLVICTTLGHFIGKFCGDVRPRPLLITHTSITLKFISDFQESKTGFSLSYLAVEPNLYPGSDCGSVAVIIAEGEIQTMNHPQQYNSNADCQWVIHSPMDHLIKITFQAFELEPSRDCIFDRLTVYHDLQGSMVAGKYCGFGLPDPILSVSNVMRMTFTSDYSANYNGFRCVISFLSSSHEVCGVSQVPPRFNYRNIAKAEEAVPYSWPWHVSIKYDNKHVCNGAIVSTNCVLTSANCVTERAAFHNLWLVVAGLHDRESPINAQNRSVKKLIIHPQYVHFDYDMALIYLNEPFQYNSFVHPICLPHGHMKPEPSDLYVTTGWDFNKKLSTKLQQLEVPVLLDDVCKRYYGRMTDRMLCAGDIAEEDNSTCSTQSGAPLVRQSDAGSYFVYGIVSRGVGCNVNSKPAVYSNVLTFIQWIKETMNSDNRSSNASSSSHNMYVPCEGIMPLQSPGDLRLVVSGKDRPEGLRCRLIFQAPKDHFILLHVNQLSLSGRHFSLLIYEGGASNKTFKEEDAEDRRSRLPSASSCSPPGAPGCYMVELSEQRMQTTSKATCLVHPAVPRSERPAVTQASALSEGCRRQARWPRLSSASSCFLLGAPGCYTAERSEQ